MKQILLLGFCLISVGTLSRVQCLKKKPTKPPGTSSRPTRIGWRQGNGQCICNGPYPSGHPSLHPSRNRSSRPPGHQSPHSSGHPGPHPSGHPSSRPSGHPSSYQSGHHGPHPTGHSTHPYGHQGPHPTGHGPHPSGHHSPHPTGHGSDPSGHHSPHSTGHGPHPSGHQSHHPSGHSGPYPSGHGPHPTGHRSYPTGHGPRPSGHQSPYPSGHPGPHPTGLSPHSQKGPSSSEEPYTRCVCGRAEVTKNIEMRLKKKFHKDLSDSKSNAYQSLSQEVMNELKQFLSKAKRFIEIKFKEGSVVVNVGAVYEILENGSIAEDPEKALRDAINSGQMKNLDIYPDSLKITESYTGVQLSEWKASLHDCMKECSHPSQTIKRTRTCTPTEGSCDGIPLTEQSTCEVACPLHHGEKGKKRGKKILIIVGICVGIIFIIAAIVIVLRLKRTNRKYVRSGPSTTSIRELTKNDELESKSKC
ncbi:uncharacterized protein LOC110240341 [Exaiptasia diaphana]|uniref:SEA domain-containing protein n=1 Tax=Exaiptasia diaphana TaxID=2652724 RepID=A0A913XAZ7_EXADI|nr:uncharacterized protein LOC110240341 [Exaiptasia diaphana]